MKAEFLQLFFCGGQNLLISPLQRLHMTHSEQKHFVQKSTHTHLSSRQYLKRHILTRTNIFSKKLSMLTNIARLN